MMAILQSMKKTARMKTLSDLLRGFCQKVENMSAGCFEIRCMFDEYKDEDPDAVLPSLKAATRKQRAGVRSKAPVSFSPHLNSKLIMSVTDLLSSSRTKRVLIPIVAEFMIEYFKTKPINLVVGYANKIVGGGTIERHCHEEADTLIPNQVLDVCHYQGCINITVISPDTDVYTQLMDLVANNLLPSRHSLILATRTKRQSPINICDNVARLGKKKAAALIGKSIRYICSTH